MNLLTRDEVLALHKQGGITNGVKALKCLNFFSNCFLEVKDSKVVSFHVYLEPQSDKIQGFLQEAKEADIEVLTYSKEEARELILRRLQ